MSDLPLSILDNAVRIESLVAPLARACRGRPVFLVDGDRTLTPDDTSRVFLKRAGLDPLVIKERFERDGYCFEAFRFHAEVHVSLGEDIFVRLAPEVSWAACHERADARHLEVQADALLRPFGLWNR